MSCFVDTNIFVRHLTGDPSDMAERASMFLAGAERLYLTDLVLAETVYVLESFYEVPHQQVATAMRSLLALPSIVTVDPALLLRTIEIYEIDRLDFAEAYLVACAEVTGIGQVASFDRAIDRVPSVERIEP
ncbi:MAG: type II toxin-antitoxin system VapC family toxin [Actinobacteria bacterium]|nr:type II toxin-antitoxin system VapC family toxin [Actinomycetota bacterium]MCB9390218.1 type II toxin-antitoxin system VapC family toxin [Acidimicrobiia bacterium]